MTAETASRIALPIKGMTCASCVAHVSRALREVEGVESVDVNLATEKATVGLGSADAPLEDLVFAIEDAGYGIATAKATLGVAGMTGASSATRVETALRGVEGVTSAVVDMATERVTIEYIPGVAGITNLRHTVEDAGYSVSVVVGDDDDGAATPRDVSALRTKFVVSLAIAGAMAS